MDSTYSQIMLNFLKTKLSIPFTNLFYKFFHSYNNFFLPSEGVFKGPKHSFIYQSKGK
jgi:hypothetical protein